MDLSTLQEVQRRLYAEADQMEVEITHYRSGQIADDNKYARLVYRQSGMLSGAQLIQDMMLEEFKARDTYA